MTEHTVQHENIYPMQGEQPVQEPAVPVYEAPVTEEAPQNLKPVVPKGDGIVEFKRPYNFEGKDYHYIDLSPIEDLSGESMMEAEKIYASEGGFSMVPEMTPIYTFAIASMATKLPVDFFRQLPIKEAVKVKNRVTGFLNS